MAELYQGKRKLSKGGLTPFQFAQKYGFEGTEQEYFSAQREAAEHLTDESNPHNVTAEQVGAGASAATKAMYGLPSGSTNDDIFSYVGKYAQHWWKRLALVSATRYKEKKTQLASGTFFVKPGAKYYKSASVDPVTGEITPKEPFDIVSVDDYYNAYVVGDFVVNKGSSTEYTDDAGVYYFTSGISKKGSSGSGSEFYQNYVQAVTAEAYQIDVGGTDFVQSNNPEAYPHSGSDGSFEYTYLGQPLENAVLPVKIATGSYVGTGGYKESAASSLTFDFAPKFLAINVDYNNKSGASIAIVRPDAYTNYAHVATIWGNRNAQLIGKVSGETVYWYSTESAHDQMNASGYTYHYIAWG